MGEEFKNEYGTPVTWNIINQGLKNRNKKKVLGEVEPLDRALTKTIIHAAENHINKGISKDGKYYTWYSDGVPSPAYPNGTPTIGDGVAITSGASKEWFSGKPIPVELVDAWTYNHLVEDDKAIRKAYDEEFGGPGYLTPSDTLSMIPRIVGAQVRYQQYRLGKNTRRYLHSLKEGNTNALKQGLYLVGKQNEGGKNRIQRILDVVDGTFYK